MNADRYMPEFLPFHPGKIFCHCRQVYLGMSFCYGVRLSVEETELIKQLREVIASYFAVIISINRSNVIFDIGL